MQQFCIEALFQHTEREGEKEQLFTLYSSQTAEDEQNKERKMLTKKVKTKTTFCKTRNRTRDRGLNPSATDPAHQLLTYLLDFSWPTVHAYL